MYNDLKTEIIDGISNTSYESEATIAISMLDVEYVINESTLQAEVTVKVIYGKNKSFLPLSCPTLYTLDVKAGVNEYCDGTFSGFDGADYINAYLDLACGFNNQITCHEPEFFSVDLAIKKYIYETSCNDYTYYGLESTCITSSMAQDIHNDIRTSWNTNCGNVAQNGHLNKIDVVKTPGSMASVGYSVYYQNAKCKQVCTQLQPCKTPVGNPDCYDKYGQPKPCISL